MRRAASWVIVAALCGLTVGAAVDTLRSDPERGVESTPVPRESERSVGDVLRAQEVGGVILYSDVACRLRSLRLPGLEDEPVLTNAGEPVLHCRFSLGWGGFLRGDVVESPTGDLLARCHNGRVVAFQARSGARVASFPGCLPAWRPDGRLSYVRRGEVVERRLPCRPRGPSCERVLLARRHLLQALRLHPNAPDDGRLPAAHVTDLVWVDTSRLALALRVRRPPVGPRSLVAVFERKRATRMTSRFGAAIGGLELSPGGSYLAARPDVLLDLDGDALSLPAALGVARAFAWSPDEHWTAVATASSVYLVRTTDLLRGLGTPRVIRLPISARDLVWETASSDMRTNPPAFR